MTWRCNHVFKIPVGGRCQWPECEAAMPPAHRIERGIDHGNGRAGIDVKLVCEKHCPKHGLGDTTPLPDRAKIETITGTQQNMFETHKEP